MEFIDVLCHKYHRTKKSMRNAKLIKYIGVQAGEIGND